MMLTPRARNTATAAPMIPKTAPEAPTVKWLGSMSSTPKLPPSSATKYTSTKRPRPRAGSSSWPSR